MAIMPHPWPLSTPSAWETPTSGPGEQVSSSLAVLGTPGKQDQQVVVVRMNEPELPIAHMQVLTSR